MQKMTKLIYVLAVVAVTALGGYYYVFVYSKTHHRNIQSEKSVTIQADSLSAQFQANEKNANALYLNKAVQVTGTIVSIDKNQEGKIMIILGRADAFSNVSVTLISTAPISQKIGETITIKGVCTGALSDVIVTEGVVQ
jgi:tRNA_anti-like